MDIQFTFGIITYVDKDIPQYLIDAVSSIRKLQIPEYEIIIVGSKDKLLQNYNFETHWTDLKLIDFDESVKPRWITKKKNIITQYARYENIVFQHDYFMHLDDWYEGFKNFGDNFEICLPKIKNLYVENGKESDRFRDLVLDYWEVKDILKSLNIPEKSCLIPYHAYEDKLSPHMYVSGGYWIAKKSFMQRYPLNESLVWGQGEDLEFSRKFNNKHKISFNPFSNVKVNKPSNARNFDIISDDDLLKFMKHFNL